VFGSGEAAAIYVHVQKIGAQDYNEEAEHDQGEKRCPDAQAPAYQDEEAEDYFREGQSMGDELDSPRGQHLKGFDLESEIGEVGRNGKLQKEQGPQGVVGKKRLGIAGVNKDGTENDTPDPDHGATHIQRARLHHTGAELLGELVQEIAQDFVAHNAGVGKGLAFGVKHGGRRLIDIIEAA
jgi:hypothetical protein